MMYPSKGPETQSSGPQKAPLARKLGLVLGIAAATAATTGCDSNGKAETATPMVSASISPEQKTTKPEYDAKAEVEKLQQELKEMKNKPAEQKAAAPTSTVTKLNPVAKANHYELSPEMKQLCEKIEGDSRLPLVVDGGEVWLLCDANNTRITKLLERCDDKYTGASSEISSAACYHDEKGFTHVDVTHADLRQKTTEKPLTLTASDEQNAQNTGASNRFWAHDKLEEQVGELDVFTDEAKIWVAYPKTGDRSVAKVTPTQPTQPKYVAPKKETPSNLDRRVGALEDRMTGVETEVSGVKRSIGGLEAVVKILGERKDEGADPHDVAAERAKKKE